MQIYIITIEKEKEEKKTIKKSSAFGDNNTPKY